MTTTLPEQSTSAPAKPHRLAKVPFLRIFVPPAPAVPPAEQTTAASTDVREVVPWERPGARLRTSERDARRGWYAPALPGAPSTTRQARVLSTAVLAQPTGTEGIVNGRDRLSRSVVAHDPVTEYNAEPKRLTSTNTLVLGDVGGGKSSFTKTVCVYRPLLLDNRRAVVFDKKDQDGEGEYAPLARRYGVEPLRFAEDGSGVRLNLFDPDVVRGTRHDDASAPDVVRLLNTICDLRRGRGLDEWEEAATRAAVRAMFTMYDGNGRAPTPADLLPLLGMAPDLPGRDGLSPAAKERLHQAGLTVRWVLEGLLDEFGALLDGDTSSGVDLSRKLTVFDVSQLPSEGPAVPVIMAIGHEWLKGRLARERGWVTHVVYEEGWHMVQGPTARLVQSSQKLSRSLGIANTFVMHKGSDIPEGSPGMSVIQEAQTVYVFAMDRPEEAAWCTRTFGMANETAGVIQRLRVGHCLMKVAKRPEVHVQHVRSRQEEAITDTDTALAAAKVHR